MGCVFSQYAAINHLINNNSIISSRYLPYLPQSQTLNKNINYAWAAALLDHGCFNSEYKPLDTHCTRLSIQKTINNYNHLLLSQKKKIQIPGISQQIDFFLQDVQSGRTKSDKKTLYILWGGGNNLIFNLNKLEDDQIKAGLWGFWQGINDKLNANIERLLKPPINAQTIYVLNIFPPSLTPRYYNKPWVIKAVLDSIVNHFNNNLNQDIEKLKKKYPHAKIHLVPIGHWLSLITLPQKDFSDQLFPIAKRGLTCQADAFKHGQDYSREPTPKNNCTGYLFWNAVHPSMETHQIIAYELEKLIEQNNSQGV